MVPATDTMKIRAEMENDDHQARSLKKSRVQQAEND